MAVNGFVYAELGSSVFIGKRCQMACKGCNGSSEDKKATLNGLMTAMGNMAVGGMKMFMSQIGALKASDEQIDDRKSKCIECDSYDFGVCNECGCFLAAKVSLVGEKCPKGKW